MLLLTHMLSLTVDQWIALNPIADESLHDSPDAYCIFLHCPNLKFYQKVDFSNAKWIWGKDNKSGNQKLVIRKKFNVETIPNVAEAFVACDTKFWLWVNSTLVVYEGGVFRESLNGSGYAEKVDISKPTIVVEHEPRNLSEISKQGVDLHLAGHTHAGQIFPLSLGAMIMWPNLSGQKQFGNMTSIVTPGIGIYGPFLRVGTNSEISVVNVKFN